MRKLAGTAVSAILRHGLVRCLACASNQGPSEHWMLAERIADLLAVEGTTSRVVGAPARSP